MTSGAFASAGLKEARTMSRSSITTAELLPNPHPGEILLEEFLKPMALSQTALARAIGVPPRRINEIVLGKRAVTADTDLRLARYFGLSDGFWLGLQSDHDLLRRRREIALNSRISNRAKWRPEPFVISRADRGDRRPWRPAPAWFPSATPRSGDTV